MANKIIILLFALALIVGAVNIFTIGLVSAQTWSGGAQTSFTTGSNIVCSSDGTKWHETDGTLSDSLQNCYRNDAVPTTCCPSGQICGGTTANSQCLPASNYFSCSELTKDQCNLYSTNPPEGIKLNIEQRINLLDNNRNIIDFCHSPYLDTSTCGSINEGIYAGDCGCKWDNSNSACVEDYIISHDVCDKTIAQSTTYECRTISSKLENTCDQSDGKLKLTWKQAIYDNSNKIIEDSSLAIQCPKSGSKEFACPIQSSLGFFGFYNFIISLLGIFAIYFVMKIFKYSVKHN